MSRTMPGVMYMYVHSRFLVVLDRTNNIMLVINTLNIRLVERFSDRAVAANSVQQLFNSSEFSTTAARRVQQL